MADSDLLAKLTAVVERLSQSAPPAAHAQAASTPFGLPQPTTMFGPQAMPGQAMPQPTGVSVPVTVPLPDGRELSVRVHFGPEALGSLQGLAAACAAMFGPYLQARQPYRGAWGGGFASHYNGRGRGRW